MEQIGQGARRLLAELPALRRLSLAICLELKARHDVQHFLITLPQLSVRRSYSPETHLTVSLRREQFNELVGRGLAEWQEAYRRGRVAISGPEPILKLLGRVISRVQGRRGAAGG